MFPLQVGQQAGRTGRPHGHAAPTRQEEPGQCPRIGRACRCVPNPPQPFPNLPNLPPPSSLLNAAAERPRPSPPSPPGASLSDATASSTGRANTSMRPLLVRMGLVTWQRTCHQAGGARACDTAGGAPSRVWRSVCVCARARASSASGLCVCVWREAEPFLSGHAACRLCHVGLAAWCPNCVVGASLENALRGWEGGSSPCQMAAAPRLQLRRWAAAPGCSTYVRLVVVTSPRQGVYMYLR